MSSWIHKLHFIWFVDVLYNKKKKFLLINKSIRKEISEHRQNENVW